MNYALQVMAVSKYYPDFSLDEVSITLPKGCIMGLIGENGAGKSTIIKLILDLIQRDSGEIYTLGQEVKNKPSETKEHIGVVLDESCFPESLNADNVNKIMKNIYKTWNEVVFHSYMERFKIPTRKRIKEYSHGMKMKLAISVALSHDSRLLILDEATSGLDPIIRDEILDVFLEFIQNEEHSIFMTSHITSDLEKICDYISFIHQGRLVFSQAKDELIDQFGLLKCSNEDFDSIDPSIVKGYRKNQFGVEALVDRQKLNHNFIVDRASIEDIMLYHIKEKVQ